MATDSDNHGGLYFIVGALVIVAVIAGILFIQNGEEIGAANTPNVIERTERTIERTIDNDDNSSSLEMRVDDSGVSATTTNND